MGIIDNFKIYSLASGSKGNCLLVTAGETKILVDMGISCRKLQSKLAEIGCAIGDLTGVVITHEHQDHVAGLRVFMKNYDINVFAKNNTWRGMKCWGELRRNFCQVLPETMLLGQVVVDSFAIPHDAAEPVGFNFNWGNKKCSVVTDIGFPSSLIKEKLRNTDYLVLESNHDLEMLNTGFYPEVLKQRIKSNRGHLSNVDAGWLLNELVADKPMRVLLAHLSQENNLPSLALNTVAEILKKQDNRHKIDLKVASQEKIVIL